MDGKTRGGKRLQKGVRQPWPMGWAVVLLVAVALVYTGVLFNMGRRMAQGAPQGGAQGQILDGDLRVVGADGDFHPGP